MKLVLIFVALIWTASAAKNSSLLNFSYITSLTGDFIASGGIAAVDIALEQINNTTEILPNHTLRYTEILDSNVS